MYQILFIETTYAIYTDSVKVWLLKFLLKNAWRQISEEVDACHVKKLVEKSELSKHAEKQCSQQAILENNPKSCKYL